MKWVVSYGLGMSSWGRTSEVEEGGDDEQVGQHDGRARHADGGGLGQGLGLHAQPHTRGHARHDTLESFSQISIQ